MKLVEAKRKTSKGHHLFTANWEVEQPKAVIVLVHGLGEHILRYQHFAKFFNDRKIAVFGYDHQGHGQSDGKRGHINSYDGLLDDLNEHINEAKKAYPSVPLFVYGHSMGGNICLNYAFKRDTNFKGLIVTASAIRLAEKPSAGLLAIGKLMYKIYPKFTQPNGLDANHISKNPDVVKTYLDDPLVHGKMTSQLGLDLYHAVLWLDEYKGNINIPALLMHGEEDQISSYKGTKDLSDRLEGDVDCKIWDGMYHEIHNEAAQNDVFEYTFNWIEKKL